MRVAFDTNVVVSAFATRGLCADLLAAVLVSHELVLGETVLAEVARVLHDKLGVPAETVQEADAFLRGQARVVSGGHDRRGSTQATAPEGIEGLDAADRSVVAEALAGGAETLVTGDLEMLALTRPPLRIVSPRGLWDLLRTSEGQPDR